MEEKIPIESHHVRMHSQRYAKCKTGNYPKYTEEFVTEQVEQNGVLVSRSALKKIKVSERFKGLRPSDFSLENVIAAGAIGNLKQITINGGSDLESVEKSIANMENLMDSAAAAAAASADSSTTSE